MSWKQNETKSVRDSVSPGPFGGYLFKSSLTRREVGQLNTVKRMQLNWELENVRIWGLCEWTRSLSLSVSLINSYSHKVSWRLSSAFSKSFLWLSNLIFQHFAIIMFIVVYKHIFVMICLYLSLRTVTMLVLIPWHPWHILCAWCKCLICIHMLSVAMGKWSLPRKSQICTVGTKPLNLQVDLWGQLMNVSHVFTLHLF